MSWVSEPESHPVLKLSANDLSSRPSMAGFLNLIHPNRVQVLGEEEIAFLEKQDLEDRERTVEQLFESKPLAVIVGDDLEMPEIILGKIADKPTALMRSSLPAF